MTSFKQYTAKQILEMLKRENAETSLEQLAFYKKAHHREKSYQVWEEGFQPKLIQSGATMKSKIDYIHHNPVKRGYVDEAEHWRYMLGTMKVKMDLLQLRSYGKFGVCHSFCHW